MNFRPRPHEEPEINLIPFIDVLLVILIFLMLSTTYSRLAQLQLQLPVANAEAEQETAQDITVAINSEGSYSVNQKSLSGRSLADLTQAIQDSLAPGAAPKLIIYADAAARHQAVVAVMEAARRAGLSQITFATQSTGAAK